MALLILVLILLGVWLFKKKAKPFNKISNVTLVTGGVKCGKTSLALALSLRQYRRQLISYYFVRIFKKDVERPLFYSNIPVKLKNGYVPLTNDYLLRQKRFNYKSIVFISEASLVADNMSFKDNNINTNLTLFVKLFAHETKGGYLFYETQAIEDCHYAFKRNINSYIYIDRLIKFIPFILVYNVYDIKALENFNTTIDVNDKEECKHIIVFKSIFKKYDTYTYSILTDNLCNDNYIKKINKYDTLKTDYILSVRKDLKENEKK